MKSKRIWRGYYGIATAAGLIWRPVGIRRLLLLLLPLPLCPRLRCLTLRLGGIGSHMASPSGATGDVHASSSATGFRSSHLRSSRVVALDFLDTKPTSSAGDALSRAHVQYALGVTLFEAGHLM
ncbi:hypothetical protein HJFPF1_06613 [Paramyrothecium foliicola]|nr:hypothetical protein HJFPF1_06613 [Paramyrothecium foliicola]